MTPSSSSLSKGFTQACQSGNGEVRQVREGSQRKCITKQATTVGSLDLLLRN